MEKKFELTNNIIKLGNEKLYQIRALRDFNEVKRGDLGGYIEKEANLSHIGNCWIYGDAWVCGNAMVYDDARVYGNARVYSNARVYGDARVCGNARVYSNARVYGDARVYSDARVCGNARVYGNAWVYGNARVYGNAKVLRGSIISKVSLPFKNIIQIQCEKRIINAILTTDNTILFNVGCQENITKETFLDRIYNENGGLEKNPHRQEYLDHIDYMESYLKKHI